MTVLICLHVMMCYFMTTVAGQGCHQKHCNNAASCRTTNGSTTCICINGTTGPKCGAYGGGPDRLTGDNIVLGKGVLQCNDRADSYLNLGNITWSHDVCFNTTPDNVLIVDLEDDFVIHNITFDPRGFTGNITTTSGQRLQNNCSLRNEANSCSTPVNGSVHVTSVCYDVTPVRYIRIKVTTNGSAVVCLNKANGFQISRYMQQAHFGPSQSTSSTVLSFSEYRNEMTRSKTGCARTCLADPVCLNFRWTNSTCSMYGGAPNKPENALSIQTFSTFH